jgi:hypothetical protein
VKSNNDHVGIDGVQRGLRRFDLRRADRLGAVEDLALQVGEVDVVGVGDGQAADACRGEVKRGRATEAAGADDQDARAPQPLLPISGSRIWRL